MGIYSYDEIFYSEWCIRFGYLELLKDKVIRGCPLIFSDTFISNSFEDGDYEHIEKNKPKEYMKSNDIRYTYDGKFYQDSEENGLKLKYNLLYYVESSIFNVYKEDIIFFSNLFKNYSDYFLVNTKEECDNLFSMENEKNKEIELPESYNRMNNKPLTFDQILNYSIVFDNVAALKVLVSIKREIPKLYNNFYKAFDIGSLKVAEYIYLDLFNGKLNKETTDSLWKDQVFSRNGNSKINILKIQFMFNLLKAPIPVDDVSISKKVTNLITKLFDFKIRTQSLEKVLESCYYLSTLYHDSGEELKSLLDNHNKDHNEADLDKTDKSLLNENFRILAIKELDEIKLQHQEKEELIKEIGIFEVKNEMIKKLFEMLIPYTDFKKFNYTFYKAKYYNHFFDNIPRKVLDKSWFAIYEGTDIGRLSNAIQENDSIKYCLKEDLKEKTKEFIRLAIIDCKDPKIKQEDKLKHDQIYKYTVLLDDIESFKYAFDQFNGNFVGNYYGLIKSTEMFDFIYNQTYYCRSMFQTVITNYKIVNHFKFMYPEDYRKTVDNILSIDSWQFVRFSNFKFIFENWLDFNTKFEKSKLMSKLEQVNITESQFDQVIKMLRIIELPYFTKETDQDYIYNCMGSLKKYFYVLENYPLDLKLGVCSKLSNSKTVLAEYYRNNLKTVIENEDIRYSFNFEEDIIKEIIKRSDTISLDYLIKELSKKKKSQYNYTFEERLRKIISESINRGNIFIYKHLINVYGIYVSDLDLWYG